MLVTPHGNGAVVGGSGTCQTLAVVTVTPQRSEEMRSIIQMVHQWAAEHDDVRGVAVVGSWARDAARMDSDVDIVVLTDTLDHADAQMWMRLLGGQLMRLQRWGPLIEVRIRRPSGFEVEMGIVPLSWATTAPVDDGTYRVISDGHRIIYDPDGILGALSTACRMRSSTPRHPQPPRAHRSTPEAAT